MSVLLEAHTHNMAECDFRFLAPIQDRAPRDLGGLILSTLRFLRYCVTGMVFSANISKEKCPFLYNNLIPKATIILVKNSLGRWVGLILFAYNAGVLN